ncbi:uncharacterized protein LOC129584614 [Paramacrobiotus metropolitanus]|uniref:uncharacterized protein LOC129584614 n=1 Tax=Paramacrobiotus metropolitanus TaxID=2943436 RepID=UPI002445C689|nr:uncharacterized protein LOC129584614 [Paramacrobiotus metropolitanus]
MMTITNILWTSVLLLFCLLLSFSECGKGSKRGGRHDSGKLVATLCHYYSDGAMGCKECYEVARSHRSNHNSTLLPPCKSVQGVKRRNWTLEDGILPSAIIELNTTKRVTLASCAFYSNNKTYTCVATRLHCDNMTEVDCANNTSWSGRYEGSVSEGFRWVAPPINGSKPAKHFNGTWNSTTKAPPAPNATLDAAATTSSMNISGQTTTTNTTSPTTTSTSFVPLSKASSTALTKQSTTQGSTPAQITQITSQAGSTKTQKTSDLSVLPTSTTDQKTSSSSTSELLVPERINSATTPGKTTFTLTSLVTTQVQSSGTTEFSENCTTTSCTIFVETSAPNTTTSVPLVTGTTLVTSMQPFNETQVQDSPKGDDGENSVGDRQDHDTTITSTAAPTTHSGSIITITSLQSGSESSAEADKSTSQSSTTHVKMILMDEVITPTTAVQSTSTPATTSTTTMAVFPTFATNISSSKHPEPRKRQPIRRMY